MLRLRWTGILIMGVFLGGAAALRPALAGGKRSDAEVKVTVDSTKADADGKQVITIQMEINKGWHIYGNPVGFEDLAAAQTVVKVAGKTMPTSVKVDYPKPHVVDDKVLKAKYAVYEDKVTIKATVQRAAGDRDPLEVSIRFQACNERGSCLFPATVKKTVP